MGPPHLHGGCHTGRLSPGGEDCARCPSLGPRSVGGGQTCLWWELTGRRLSGEPVPLQRKDEDSGLGDPKKWPLASPSKMTCRHSSAANRPGSPSLNRSRKEGPLDVGKRPLALDTGVKAHGTEQPGAQTARGESGKSGAGQRRRVARPGETG